jgi:hypothetical protein
MESIHDPRHVFQDPLPSLEATLSHVMTLGVNVLVCGTFFIMKDVRKALGHPHGKLDECDEDLLNETK